MADGPLKGRVAIITGASGGIGAAVAETLAQAGAKVVLAARRLERIQAIAEALENSGCEALAVRTDVTNLEDMRALAEAAKSRFDGIDILVSNAGVMPVAPFTEGQVDEWKLMVDVNVNGVLHGIAAVLPTMIEQRSGHLVNIGSVASRRPFPGGSVYSATKFAVRGLSWGLHLELGAKYGIRVTDIQPGLVATELFDTVPEFREGLENAWEGKRMLQPQDVADSVLFALSAPEHVSVSEVLVRPVDQGT